jgi:two-component system, OmpR family, sensor histidine kinase KdpD
MGLKNSENPGNPHPWEYLPAFIIVGICTIVCLPLSRRLAAANLVMIYLAGVVVAAGKCHRRVAIFTSLLSVAAFDFFYVPPYLTFAISQYEYLITFCVMLGVALFISAMTARIHFHASAALAREVQTGALYRLLNDLTGKSRIFEMMKIAADLAEDTFHSKVTIFLPDQKGVISFSKRTSDQLHVPSTEQPIAQWVFEHLKKAGKNTGTHPKSSALYVPIANDQEVFGVMAVVSNTRDGKLSSEEEHLLEIFVRQTALAVQRSIAASTAHAAEVRVETESTRTSLLSAVSHDLRTPLSSITGAAATLRSHWDRLEPTVRSELLTSVTDETDRLSRLLNNIIEVTKLEGGVHLQKERYPLEEIVGAALHRLRAQLTNRRVITDIPADFPMVAIDAVLMEQVFINLIENAMKYTPEGSHIEIAACTRPGIVEVEVRDSGTGFAPGHEDRIFDRFFRGHADNTRGAGLGLAICRAVVEAHGGLIQAVNRSGSPGAIIRFQLPLTDSNGSGRVSARYE